MKNLLLILSFISLPVLGSDFCDRTSLDIVTSLEVRSSRIGFKNQGGLFNGGVCWWHSRLQRASAYLVIYRPEKRPPTVQEAVQIIKTLKTLNKVVEIPGFKDFLSFSMAYQNQMQSVLEAWQREDGFFNMQWVRGISGRSELGPDQMKNRMETLYQQFLDSPHPLWIMAQIKGIESHSFLVLDMVPTPDGFELRVIDSNLPKETTTLRYSMGERSLKHPRSSYTFVPYSGFQKDYDLIFKSLKNYCNSDFSLWSRSIPKGEIELGPQ